MKIKVKVKNGKIVEWHGMFLSKERKVINEAFNNSKDKSDGIKIINVKELG